MSIADKLTTIAENQQAVYDAGFFAGQAQGGGGSSGDYDEGWNDGYAQGYDEGWDEGYWSGYGDYDGGGEYDYAYNEGYDAGHMDGRQEGERSAETELWSTWVGSARTNYSYMFSGSAFAHIAPKVDLKPQNAQNMFSACPNLETVDWSKVDFSDADIMFALCSNSQKLKSVDTDVKSKGSGNTYFNEMFRWCKALTRIQKITAYPTAIWTNTFQECNELTHVIFDGTIGANGLDLHWSTKLDKESLESIINALSDETDGLSITLSRTAVENAYPQGDVSDPDWVGVLDAKGNWNIYYA